VLGSVVCTETGLLALLFASHPECQRTTLIVRKRHTGS
jgi:hypothetical protein